MLSANEEEGYLALEINHGRRLIALGVEYEFCPDLLPLDDPDPVTGVDLFQRASDAIASILAAGAWEGIEPNELWRSARGTQNALFSDACDAAWHRQPDAT